MIDKARGFDNYILKTPTFILKSKKGEELKDLLKDEIVRRNLMKEALKENWTI
jgi:hypothetical protein